MCQQAIDLGLEQIAFTEHVDFMPLDMGYGFFQPEAYFGEIGRCRELFGEHLAILAAAEVGEFHRYRPEIDKLLASCDFDLVMGSLHWVGDQIVFEELYFARRPGEQAYRDYFVELERMCRAGGFDVLGHLDIVKRYGFELNGGYDVTKYEDAIRPVLEALVRNNIALEINASTLHRPVKQASPDLTVLQWYRDLGGELLTVGSDAHSPDQLSSGASLALELAQAAGFGQLATFSNRTPIFMPLEST